MNKQLIEKIHEAVLQMMEDVLFDKKKHIYTRVSDGSWLQGVSTVSSIVPKPWLPAWGAKEVVKYLGFSDYDEFENAEKMLEKIKKMDVDTYFNFLKYAKGASSRKSKDALADGTKGHAWLETYVKARIRNEVLPEIPGGMLERPINQFLEWENNVDYWILSEAQVVSLKHSYAGTLDGLAMMKTGKLALIDFKFASRISEDAYLQTAGYQNCFEEYDIHVDQRIIIRLPKTLTIDLYDKKTRTYSKVENKLEAEIVKTDYNLDRDVFIHCLPLKRWINALNK